MDIEFCRKMYSLKKMLPSQGAIHIPSPKKCYIVRPLLLDLFLEIHSACQHAKNSEKLLIETLFFVCLLIQNFLKPSSFFPHPNQHIHPTDQNLSLPLRQRQWHQGWLLIWDWRNGRKYTSPCKEILSAWKELAEKDTFSSQYSVRSSLWWSAHPGRIISPFELSVGQVQCSFKRKIYSIGMEYMILFLVSPIHSFTPYFSETQIYPPSVVYIMQEVETFGLVRLLSWQCYPDPNLSTTISLIPPFYSFPPTPIGHIENTLHLFVLQRTCISQKFLGKQVRKKIKNISERTKIQAYLLVWWGGGFIGNSELINK